LISQQSIEARRSHSRLFANVRKRTYLERIPVRGVRLHVHESSRLTPMPFLSDDWLHRTATQETDTNMFRQLIVVAAIATAALVLIRRNAQRSDRHATDEAARADWESEGGASATPRGSAPPSV
jgi:hypothetical protein